jgi:hypothetical protein
MTVSVAYENVLDIATASKDAVNALQISLQRTLGIAASDPDQALDMKEVTTKSHELVLMFLLMRGRSL